MGWNGQMTKSSLKRDSIGVGGLKRRLERTLIETAATREERETEALKPVYRLTAEAENSHPAGCRRPAWAGNNGKDDGRAVRPDE